MAPNLFTLYLYIYSIHMDDFGDHCIEESPTTLVLANHYQMLGR